VSGNVGVGSACADFAVAATACSAGVVDDADGCPREGACALRGRLELL
jgi:hypothetical protein